MTDDRDTQPGYDPSKTVRMKRGDGKSDGDATPRKAVLTVIRGSGNDLGRHVVIESSLVIGRVTDVDFTVHDLGVSRQHVRVERQSEDTCVLRDLGSTNGTLVNGAAVTEPRVLANGDKIFLGETVLRFSLADDLEIGYQLEVANIVGQDPLTGLESKRRFDDALSFALENAKPVARPLAMLMMDMDGVKKINDTHGHVFGAYVISETGRLIARHLTPGGHACRFGGDEFSAFLPGLAKDEAVRVAEAIRAAVEAAGLEKDGIALHPTISIGVSAYPEDADTPIDLLVRADGALYRAKRGGRNRVAV